jgi:hypothetical protein
VAIVELDDALNRLNIDDDDGELQDFIDALAVPVENHLHEIIVPRAVDEDLELCGRPKFWLTNNPVISLTSLVSIDGAVTYPAGNFKVRPSGLVRVVTGPRPSGVVTATYQAGYATIPPNIREGALVILQHLWETQRGAGGIMAGVVGPEEIRRVLSTFTIPAKAREWLGDPTTLAR